MPFLWTLAAAGAVAALLGAGIGAVVFRVRGLRGELFALLTLAITFVLATIILNTRIDGGPGVYLSAVPLPRLMPSPTGTLYLLGLALAVATVWRPTPWRARGSASASLPSTTTRTSPRWRACRPSVQAPGVRALGGVAGVAGGIHAMYVSYVTVGETFSITVPLYVVLMSVLGGARHWLGPAIGATHHHRLLYAFTGGQQAVVGRAVIALLLILVDPVPARRGGAGAARALARVASVEPQRRRPGAASPPADRRAPLPRRRRSHCRDVWKAFGGIQALRGVSLASIPARSSAWWDRTAPASPR